MKRAMVLGCGPAGLLAAEALGRNGWAVSIMSHKVRSPMPGAQYLHKPIPGVTSDEPDMELEYIKIGDRDGYAAKVYGSPAANCSWDEFPEGLLPAWSMGAAYDRLWDKWESTIMNTGVSSEMIPQLLVGYDMVVSTVPGWALCEGGHDFEQQPVWTESVARPCVPPNTIIYNGQPEDPWYRTSLINGKGSTEYAQPVESARIGAKPIQTDCTCHPKVLRQGRFGRWKKGILVHHVWEEMNLALLAV